MVPVVELGLGPVVSKAINSDFLEGDTGTIGLVEPAGIENPITEDVGRVLRGAGPEDGDAVDEEVVEVEVRRRSAHNFLTVAGASGTSWEGAGVEGVEVWIGPTTLEEVTEEEDSTSSPGCGVEASSSSSAVPTVS